jgi:uncharacterized repeat protein (TIGR02543 family)
VDPVLHTVAVTTTNLATFALGVEALVTFTVEASAAPANSGTITGTGDYASGASVTLVATPAAGYVFASWTESGVPVSTSPSFTFLVQDHRTLVANFEPVGAAKSISTSSSPSNGGTTSGDGAYAVGASATVSATANYGYKFSKWQVNGVTVSSARNYTFTVSTNRVLVAKFKPVYYLDLSPEPAEGGDVEGDPAYELGELAKLKAKPNQGWSFLNWTQNGVPVSTDPNFQFNVTANRTLVGNFVFGNLINVTASPANAGAVTGGGVYPENELVVVEAVAHPGYVFVDWTEAGDSVSTDAVFTITADASYNLVANFVAQPALTSAIGAGGIIAFAWPAGANGWVLQECSDLELGDWADSTRPVTVVGNRKRVEIPTATGTAFFRLVRP